MPSLISNQQFFRLTSTVVTKKYTNTVQKEAEEYSSFFNELPAGKLPFIQLQPYTGMGLMSQLFDATAPALDAPVETNPFTATFLQYGLGYEYSENAEDDDVANMLGKLAGMLAYSRVITEEYLYWNVPNNAFNAGVTGKDGVALCANNHPIPKLAGQTQSNFPGAVALSPEALFAARMSFKALVDERGLPIKRTPRWLLVPLELENTAGEILGTSDYPYSDENRKNMEKGKLQAKVVRYLTSATAWFVSAGKGEIGTDAHPLFVSHKYKDRQQNWTDKKLRVFGHMAYFRSIWGFPEWYGFYGSQGA